MNFRLVRRIAVGLVLGLIGCGPGTPPTGTVKGTVTLDDKPITGARISFLPMNGQSYTAFLGPAGDYVLEGVPVGEATVVLLPDVGTEAARHQAIKESKGEAPAAPPHQIPLKYVDINTSPLKYKVVAGANDYNPKLAK